MKSALFKLFCVMAALVSISSVSYAQDTLTADEGNLIALLDKYKANMPDIVQKMMKAKDDETVKLGEDENKVIAETSSFFNELLAMKKGTQAYQSLRGKLTNWKKDYLGIERALMMGRALIVQKVLKDTLIQFYNDNPKAIGTIYGEMDIGTWVKMQTKTLQFDKDIDLSSLSTDDDLNMRLRDMFKQNLQKISRSEDAKIMINIDALITPHGKASSEVFIGEWGKTFAEMDLLSRGKWKLIILKLEDGRLALPDEAKRIREQGGRIKVVDIVTKEMPGSQLFWWRAFMEGKDFDPPQVTMKTEPMISLEMSRHLIADIERGNYSGIDKLVKVMKYVERSYLYNQKATAKYRGDWDPFDDNDRVLGEFAVELTKAKQAKDAGLEMAKVFDKYKDKLNLEGLAGGDKETSDKIINELLRRSKESIIKNSQVALALRLREIASVRDEGSRNRDLGDMLEQMNEELETYKHHVGDYPEGRIKDIIWLSKKLREGDKWSAEVVKQTMDDLIEALRQENYHIDKGIIEYIFSADDARQLRAYLREKMKWTDERINKFIEDLKKKYPSLAKGYDRLKDDYQNIDKEIPTFAKIHKKIMDFNEDWSNTIEGSRLLTSLDFADNALAVYDAYMSEDTHPKAAVKAAGAILKIKTVGAFPSLSVAEGIVQAYQEGDTGPAIKSFAFYYFPTIGAFWGLGEKLQRFDVFVRDREFIFYLDKMRSKIDFDPKTGHVVGIKTTSKYGEFLQYSYSPNQQQRADNFADFFMKSDNLISGDALPEFRFWMTLIPRSSERYGYGGDFISKGDEALQNTGTTWIGEKLGIGSMDISGKKGKYAKLKKYFSYNEELLAAVLILENKNNAPGFTEFAGPKLAQKRDQMIQDLETNIERAVWKSLLYLLEASAIPPKDLEKLIKELEQLESDLDLAGYDLSDIRGMNNGLMETIKKEVKSQISQDYYGVFVYKKYHATYSEIKKIQSQIIQLWTEEYGVDWQKMINPPLKMILGGSKSSAPRLTLDLQSDLAKARNALVAHKSRGRRVDSDLYDALGHSPKSHEELGHRKKLAQLGFEIEHLFDDCRERSIDTCEAEIVQAINERLIQYREYLRNLKTPECTYQYSDWDECDMRMETQRRRVIEKLPKDCLEKDKPVLERKCKPPSTCSYRLSEWSECSRTTRQQTRSVIAKEPLGCIERNKPLLEQNCTPMPPPGMVDGTPGTDQTGPTPGKTDSQWIPTCSYRYSEWGECSRAAKKQTRTVIGKEPEGCVERGKPVLEQGCTPPPTEEEKRNSYLNCLCRCSCGWAGHIGVWYDPDGKSVPECKSNGPCFGGAGAWGCTSRHFFVAPNDCAKGCWEGAFGKGTYDPDKADRLRKDENKKYKKPLTVTIKASKNPADFGDIVELTAETTEGSGGYKWTWGGCAQDAKDARAKVLNSRECKPCTASVTATDQDGDSASASLEVKCTALKVKLTQETPKETTIPIGGKATFLAEVFSGDKPASGSFSYIWERNPDALFGDPKNPAYETKGGSQSRNTATFKKMGTTPVWVSVLKEVDGRKMTVGESEQIPIQAVSPKLKLSINKEEPLIGEKVVLTVHEEPAMSNDIITFWWEIKGDAANLGPEPNIPNSRSYSFKPKNAKPVTITVHAKAKEDGSDLGQADVTVNPKGYAVTIGEPRYLGPKPKIWKCETQLGGACPGLVDVGDQQFAVHHDVFMKSAVNPVLSGARYRWEIDPAGTCGIPGAGDELKMNCSDTGTFTVSLKVANSDGDQVGEASRSVTISVSQKDMDGSKKAKEAQEKIQRAKGLVAEGKLDEGIALADEAAGLDPKNSEAPSLISKWKSDKATILTQLDQTKKLIGESKFPEAQKALAVAKNLHGKYQPVMDTEKLLNEKMNDYSKQTKDVADKLGKAKDLVSRGKLDEAIAAADEACKLDPKNTEASALANKLKSQQISVSRQLDKVKELIKEAKFPEAQKELAVAKEFLGKYAPVVETEKLLNEKMNDYSKQTKDVADKLGKAKDLVSQGKLEEAIAAADEACKLDPKNTEASALANKLKSQKISVSRQLDKVKELIKEAKFPEAQKELAVAKEFLGKYTPVVETEKLLNEKLAEYNKKQKEAADKTVMAGKLKEEGSVLEKQGKLKEAIAKFKESLKLVPDKTIEDRITSIEGKLRDSQEKEAKEALARNLKTEGDNLMSQGKPQEALSKYRESLKTVSDPNLEKQVGNLEKQIADEKKSKPKEDASVKPATPPSRAPTEAEIKYVKGFAGKWNTTFKVMELSVEGNRVSGRYSHDNGRIDATLSADGKTMEGTWSEAPSYKPPQDAGRVIFKLSQDGNSLAGQWWYGQDGKGGDWTGTRVVETDAKKDPGAQPETVGKSDDGERSLKAVVGQWNLFTGETVGTAREKIAAYKGSLVFSVSNGKLAGKLMLHNYWEELKNVFFTNGTITFDRPIPGLVQHYQGKVMAGGRIEGTFTHKNSTQAWWAQSSEGSDTGTVKTVSPAVSVPSTQAGQTPSSSAVESVIFDNWNIGGVDNGPTQSTVFTISQSITITKITNYHWNSGRGATPGTIALRSQNGQQYGPWTASGTAGQGGVKNANWHVSPNVVLPPGTYTVIDSAPATWAQNGQSKGRGFTRVEGRGAASAPADTSSPTTPPVTTAAPRTVVAEITNRSSMNTHVFTEGENFGPANKLSPGEKRKVSVTMKSDGTIVFKAGRNGKVMATKVWQGDPKDVKRFPVVVFDDTNPLDKLTVITCLR